MLNENQKLLVKAYKEYTHDNHHTKALMILAEAAGQRSDAKILHHIEEITQLEGELPHHLNQYRETVRKVVERTVKEQLPEVWAALLEMEAA